MTVGRFEVSWYIFGLRFRGPSSSDLNAGDKGHPYYYWIGIPCTASEIGYILESDCGLRKGEYGKAHEG